MTSDLLSVNYHDTECLTSDLFGKSDGMHCDFSCGLESQLKRDSCGLI